MNLNVSAATQLIHPAIRNRQGKKYTFGNLEIASFDPSSHIVKHWMNDHPYMKICPEFSFSIFTRFRDRLPRQVTEANIILYMRYQLLNSKNKYKANCLTRICGKKLMERQAEEQEEIERQQLQAFENKHMRPKKTRSEIESQTEEHTLNRLIMLHYLSVEVGQWF
jgi:hypothetical protein